MKLSIIVPLYNKERYIEKCIASLVAQDIDAEEYEIIVVDDGSTDSSAAIAGEIAGRHVQVCLLSKENGGLSSARNYGTDHARGSYIMYVDADDYIEERTLGQLLEVAEGIAMNADTDELDMLLFGRKYVDASGECVPGDFHLTGTAYTGKVVSGRELLRTNDFVPMVWSYLFRRDFLNGNNLRMKSVWHEDEEFTPRALYYARRVSVSGERIYNYVQQEDSYSNTYNASNIFYAIEAMRSLNDFGISLREKDPQGALSIRLRASRITLYFFCKAARADLSVIPDAIKCAREAGLIPLQGRGFNLRRLLLNHSAAGFMAYYRLKKR